MIDDSISNPLSPSRVWSSEKDLDSGTKFKKEGVSRREALIAMKNEWSGYHKDISPAIDRAWEKVYSGNLKKDTGKNLGQRLIKMRSRQSLKKPVFITGVAKRKPLP